MDTDEFTAENINDIEVQISTLMNSLCVPQKCKGYAYISKIVYLAVQNTNLLHSMTKDLFVPVASMYGVTVFSLESAINRAIRAAWKIADARVQYTLFGRTVDFSRGHPSCKDFITTLTYRTKTKMDL